MIYAAELPALGQSIDPPRRATPTLPPGLFPPTALPSHTLTDPQAPLRSPAERLASVHSKQSRTEVESQVDGERESYELPARPDIPKIPVVTPTKIEDRSVGKKRVANETKKQAPKVATPKPGASKDAAVKPKEELPKSETTEAALVTPVKAEPASGKRAHPGKLQISTAQLSEKEMEPLTTSASTPKPEILTRHSRAGSIASASVISRPGTPLAGTTSTGSPMRRTTQPRTIRITDTPRTETPPPLPVTSAAATPVLAPVAAVETIRKQASRRASVTSTNQPGTPVSDRIDNMSTTSASASRASSPPPIMTNRKAKKKEKKQKEVEIAVAATPKDTLEEAAPIMTRKTKSKKNKPSAAPQVPKATASPAPVSEKIIEAPEPVPEIEPDPVVPPKEGKLSGKGKAKAKAASPPPKPQPASPSTQTPASGKSEDFSASSPKAITAATILQALDCTHQLALSTLSLLKPLTQQSELRRLGIDPFTSVDLQNHIEQLRFELTIADEALLKQGKAVRKDLGAEGRVSGRNLVTPDRTRLACLTKEEEDRYLELEGRVKSSKGMGKWGGGRKSRQSEAVKMLNIATDTLDNALRDVQQAQAVAAQRARAEDWPAEAGDFVNQFVPPSADGSGLFPPTAPPSAPQTSQPSQGPAGPPPRFEHENAFTAQSLEEAMATAGAIANGKGLGRVEGRNLVRESERVLAEAKKDTEGFEKKLNAMIKKNKRMALGGSGGGGH